MLFGLLSFKKWRENRKKKKNIENAVKKSEKAKEKANKKKCKKLKKKKKKWTKMHPDRPFIHPDTLLCFGTVTVTGVEGEITDPDAKKPKEPKNPRKRKPLEERLGLKPTIISQEEKDENKARQRAKRKGFGFWTHKPDLCWCDEVHEYLEKKKKEGIIITLVKGEYVGDVPTPSGSESPSHSEKPQDSPENTAQSGSEVTNSSEVANSSEVTNSSQLPSTSDSGLEQPIEAESVKL